MKLTLQLFILFTILASCATEKAVQPSTDKDKEEGRMLVEGTKVSLVPPSGFISSPNYAGLQQSESGSSMMVVEMPQAFKLLKTSMTKEAFLEKGVEVDTIIPTIVDTYEGIHILGQQHSGKALYAKNMLVFGDDTKSVLVICAVPFDMQEIRKRVDESLKSVKYEAKIEIDPMESVSYKLTPDSTNLLFAKFISNSFVYTDDGLFPPKSEDKTTVYVSNSLSEVTIEDRKLFSINRVKEIPMDIEIIDSINNITIDDIDGYEIYAQGKSKQTGQKKNIYQVTLFSDKLYYILVGTTAGNFDNNIAEIKKLIATFERN